MRVSYDTAIYYMSMSNISTGIGPSHNHPLRPPNGREKVPVSPEGMVGIASVPIESPSTFSPSRSFIITLRRAKRSRRPGPCASGRASESKPFSNWPQSLRRDRYGLSKEESMRPRYPSVMYDLSISGRTRNTFPSWRMNSKRSCSAGIPKLLTVSWYDLRSLWTQL